MHYKKSFIFKLKKISLKMFTICISIDGNVASSCIEIRRKNILLELMMSQQQYRQRRKRRPRRIIHVSIRSIRTPQSNKTNASTDLRYSYSVIVHFVLTIVSHFENYRQIIEAIVASSRSQTVFTRLVKVI